jgi:hypothetical protein
MPRSWQWGRGDVRIDTRWAGANAADFRRHAAELAALAPDVVLAHGASAVAAMLQAARTVPIVFPSTVGSSGRRRLRRQPGAAGRQRHRFFSVEYSIAGKWLELLKQIAPTVTRVPFISALHHLFWPGVREGSDSAAELRCRRQVNPRDRSPRRVAIASASGQDLPPALQKRSGDSCSEARQKWWRRGNPKFRARVSRPFPSDPGRDSLCAAAEAEKRALMKRFTETSGSLRRGKYRWRLRCCYPAGSAAERSAGGRFFRHMIVMVRAVRRALNKSAQ